MGNEYRIICSITDEVAKQILDSAPFFSGVDSRGYHQYRRADNPGPMPNASSRREPFGFYFNDYGGAREILEYILSNCIDYAPVTLDDWE